MKNKNMYTVHLVRDVFTASGVDSKSEDHQNMSLKSINEMIDQFNEDHGSPQSHFFGYKNKGFTWDFLNSYGEGKIMIAVLNSKGDLMSSDQIVSSNL